MKTLVALVENKPGVLNRVVSLIRRRGFNIDSLTVGRTENSALSRMTIVVDAGNESLIFEVTGAEDKIQAITEMLEPFGIMEMVRTGIVAMSRGTRALSTGTYKPRPYKNGKTPQPELSKSNGPFVV